MHLSLLPLPGVGAALSPPCLVNPQDHFISPSAIFGQGLGRRWMVIPGSMLTPVLPLPRCVGGFGPVTYRIHLSSLCAQAAFTRNVMELLEN